MPQLREMSKIDKNVGKFAFDTLQVLSLLANFSRISMENGHKSKCIELNNESHCQLPFGIHILFTSA